MRDVLLELKELKLKLLELDAYLSFLKDAGFIEKCNIIYRYEYNQYFYFVDVYESCFNDKDDVRENLIKFFKMVKHIKEENKLILKELNNER